MDDQGYSIGKDNPNVAPAGCLQYHSGSTGSIASFNYDLSKNVGNGNIDGLAYSSCFRGDANFCGIEFEPVTSEANRTRRHAPYQAPTQYYSSYAKPAHHISPVYQYPVKYLQPQHIYR